MTPTATVPTPAADPTGPPPSPGPPDLMAEPTFEECIEEGVRYSDDLKAGRLDFTGIPEGHFFAYYGGKIHDHDADPNALDKRVGAALGVHWARVRVFYHGEW